MDRSKMLKYWGAGIVAALAMAQASACTSKSASQSDQPDASASGAGGSAGEQTGGTAGQAGSGVGGTAGSAGQGGSGGVAGSAGEAGGGGTAGIAGAGGSVDYPCQGIDSASAEAAFLQLEGGATEVQLDPSGCSTYKRTLDGTLVAHEELTVSGKKRMVYDRTASEGHGKYDVNLDGTFDYYIDVTLDSSVTGDMVVVESWGDQAPAQPMRRETATVTGNDVHVEVEVFDAGGQLVDSSSYDGTRMQQQNVTFDPPSGAGACDQATQDAVKAAFKKALDDGRKCMFNFGNAEAADYLAEVAATKGIRIKCIDTKKTYCAEASKWDTIMGGFWGSKIDISIDPSVIGNAAACGDMAGTLFHEILHTFYGMHSPYDVANGKYQDQARQKDKMYACQAVCFDKANATKCQCSACYGSMDPCDPNCKGYGDCNQEQAQCQCLSHPGYYDTYALCAVGCPSGLACFASSCKADFKCK
ncbi:MAG: hypothetical protein HY898_24750 [Deltaproteobacteria bacterium]|nr:hypothetical protein [Deltaproteobacteria bacterium]